MITVVCLMMTYFYSVLLYAYFFNRILGKKYTAKVTMLGTLILWVISCFTKIFPFFIIGLDITIFSNIIVLISTAAYVLALYKSSVAKRILAMVILILVQGCMDMLGLNLASMLVGNYELMQLDSYFTITACIMSTPLITLGTFGLTRIWLMTEKIDWSSGKKQWFCVILPISQLLMLWRIALRYSVNFSAIPVFVICGMFIAILADVYMFSLFYQSNRRDVAERKLRQLTHQYELEQLRYEQLKETQEEAAMIRHDFQNYIIMMKEIE